MDSTRFFRQYPTARSHYARLWSWFDGLTRIPDYIVHIFLCGLWDANNSKTISAFGYGNRVNVLDLCREFYNVNEHFDENVERSIKG